jgi:glyoxylase-like metal-dependent hydrolase (beta-lactamase superfamily II)
MTYHLTVLDTGRLYMGRQTTDSGPGPYIMAPALAFLLRGPSGCVLVDTGMPDTARAEAIVPNCYQPEGWDIHSRLTEAGVAPTQLSALILTHLHWDHAALADTFAGVPKYLQAAEARHLDNLSEEDRRYYHVSPKLLADPDLRLITGTVQVLPGLEIIPTPGHTPGHQSVRAVDGNGWLILTGDAAWRGSSGKMEQPRRALDQPTAGQSFARLAGLGQTMLGSHDQTALDRRSRPGRPAAFLKQAG